MRILNISLPLIMSLSLGAAVFADSPTLSVLYFTSPSPDSDETSWLSKGLSDMLVTDLSSTGAFTLVEREQLEKLLAEQEFSLSGLADEKQAPRVGGLLSARILVYGSYLVTDSSLRLDAKAVSVESGEIRAAVSVSGEYTDALKLEAELSRRLCASLAVPSPASLPSSSLDAVRAYYRGLDSLDSGRYGEAVTFFGESVRYDPAYLAPGKGLESAYLYLKDFKRQRYRREMNTLTADIRDLSKRITAPVFFSFGDAIANPTRFGFKDSAEVSSFYNARPAVLNGDTPVVAIWNLQHLLSDLALKAVEYFDDHALEATCQSEIIFWSLKAEEAYPTDPFLPNVLYNCMFIYTDRKDWTRLKSLCERLMSEYPGMSGIEAVEGYYERAIKALATS